MKTAAEALQSTLKYLVIIALLVLQPDSCVRTAFGQVTPLLHSGDSTPSPVNMKANEQQKRGEVYELSGAVEVQYQDMTLRADKVSYNAASGTVVAEIGRAHV